MFWELIDDIDIHTVFYKGLKEWFFKCVLFVTTTDLLTSYSKSQRYHIVATAGWWCVCSIVLIPTVDT